MKATVKVENLKIYAFHGCMEEEKVIGSDYIVNIEADCFVGNGAFNDLISGTVDYVDLARIAKREMLTRSKLLEAVVKRIIDSSFEEIDVLNIVGHQPCQKQYNEKDRSNSMQASKQVNK